MQDAFVGLYRRFVRVDDPAGYLYRSVVNGRGARGRHRRVVERFRYLTARPDAAPDAPSEVDETLAALKVLPPRRRAVIVLRYYGDLPLPRSAGPSGAPPARSSRRCTGLADLRGVLER